MRLAALAVLLFDHRGYGRSNGTPNEQGTYLDAQAACDYLTNTKGLLPKSIVIIGESLGGPIAAHLAKDVAPRGDDPRLDVYLSAQSR